jgi:rare lipoprotein A
MQSIEVKAAAVLRSCVRGAASVAILGTLTAGLLTSASIVASTAAEAKTPGKTYCFLGKCHRVRTLAETSKLVGVKSTLKASFYDDPRRDRFNPSNLTSSGEYFRAGIPDNAASPTLPNGTILLAYNPATQRAAVLRINNAGPYWGNRTLDVSRGAAEKLGFAGQGVATLVTQVIRAPSTEEATYKKGRRYAAVPGFIGTHATLELALTDARSKMGLGRSPAPMPAPVQGGAIIAAKPETEAAKPGLVVASATTGTPLTVAATPALPALSLAGNLASTVPNAPLVTAAAAVKPALASRSRVAQRRSAPTKQRIALKAKPAVVRYRGTITTTSYQIVTSKGSTRAFPAAKTRSASAQGRYFRVDCRSAGAGCGTASTASTSRSAWRTSSLSASNRP